MQMNKVKKKGEKQLVQIPLFLAESLGLSIPYLDKRWENHNLHGWPTAYTVLGTGKEGEEDEDELENVLNQQTPLASCSKTSTLQKKLIIAKKIMLRTEYRHVQTG